MAPPRAAAACSGAFLSSVRLLFVVSAGALLGFVLSALGYVASGRPTSRSLSWLIGVSLGAAVGVVAARGEPPEGEGLGGGADDDAAEVAVALGAAASATLATWLLVPPLSGEYHFASASVAAAVAAEACLRSGAVRALVLRALERLPRAAAPTRRVRRDSDDGAGSSDEGDGGGGELDEYDDDERGGGGGGGGAVGDAAAFFGTPRKATVVTPRSAGSGSGGGRPIPTAFGGGLAKLASARSLQLPSHEDEPPLSPV